MKKKITLTSVALILGALTAFLTIVEKTEALIARVASRDPAYEMTEYSQDRPYLRGQMPSEIQASKQ